jgi:hypothetical protein
MRDLFHDVCRHALEKDDWTITHDPLTLKVGGATMEIDLGAEQSSISEFHMALGQYLNYQQALEEEDPNRQLYLAVPFEVHRTFFELRFVREAVQRHHLKLIVYNPSDEVIVRWIK